MPLKTTFISVIYPVWLIDWLINLLYSFIRTSLCTSGSMSGGWAFLGQDRRPTDWTDELWCTYKIWHVAWYPASDRCFKAFVMLQCMWDTQIPPNFDWCSMISHPLWRFKLISGYISSLLQDFCVYRSRPNTDRSVRSNLIHGPTNGPIDRSGPIPSQKSSVLCIGLDRGPDWTEVVHPWTIPFSYLSGDT